MQSVASYTEYDMYVCHAIYATLPLAYAAEPTYDIHHTPVM